MAFETIEEAIQDIKDGKMVIVVDDENRENEGDIVIAAEKATTENINFMITHARGLVCMPMEGHRLDELKIPPMIDHNCMDRCKFTISVDYNKGTTTGISPSDRAKTILALIGEEAKPEEFDQPGHMFPLRYHEGGVLVREGHTEASVDLAKLAGCYPAAVICEVINEDGSMAKVTDLVEFKKKHDLKMVTIEDLKNYILSKQQSEQPVEEAPVING